MTETADAEAEAARKLFAGACDFVWGATSPENLPPEKLNAGLGLATGISAADNGFNLDS